MADPNPLYRALLNDGLYDRPQDQFAPVPGLLNQPPTPQPQTDPRILQMLIDLLRRPVPTSDQTNTVGVRG